MPRNVLALPLKASPPLSAQLSEALLKHIEESYNDVHPDSFRSDIRELAKLRDEVSKVEVHQSSVDSVVRYHAQLVFLSTKFATDFPVPFPWSLAFPPSFPFASLNISLTATSYADNPNVHAHPDLNWERANVLFNLAALYSSLGAQEDRAEKESMRRAAGWFQQAAGVLSHIQTELAPKLSHLPPPPCPDLSLHALRCLENLMLAQAQESGWQRAVSDRLKDGTIAKLASKVFDLYGAALEAYDTQPYYDAGTALRFELPSGWHGHMTMKKHHFAAAAQFRKSAEDLGANRYGDELGRLKVAEGLVKKALETNKRGISEAVVNDAKSLQAVIAANLTRATRDNDMIYLQAITPAHSLQPIASVSLVRSTLPSEVSNPISLLKNPPPGTSPGVSAGALGKPLFEELVPYGVHLAISVYEDRKDTLVREEIQGRKDELDAIAASTLQSLNLPGSLQALEQPMGLPPSLTRKAEEVRLEGGLRRLQKMVDDVARMARSDKSVLSEALSIIDQEAAEDEHARGLLPADRFSRQPSHVSNRELAQQGESYRRTIAQAAESDQIVANKLEEAREVMEVLSGGQDVLEAFVPSTVPNSASLAASPLESSASAAAIVRSLRSSLESLDDLLDSRAACLAEARHISSSDDVRPTIMREAASISKEAPGQIRIEPAHFEELFQRELAKYRKLKQEVEGSGREQEEVLERIRELNESFVASRKVDQTVKQREQALQTLEQAHRKYREIQRNLEEGLKFYNDLARLLSAFRQRCKEYRHERYAELQAFRQQQQQQQQPPQAQAPPQTSPSAGPVSSPAAVSSPPTAPKWGRYDPSKGGIQFGD